MILELDGLLIVLYLLANGIMDMRFGFCSFQIIGDLFIKKLLRYFGFI